MERPVNFLRHALVASDIYDFSLVPLLLVLQGNTSSRRALTHTSALSVSQLVKCSSGTRPSWPYVLALGEAPDVATYIARHH
jgi:hypothetical protein